MWTPLVLLCTMSFSECTTYGGPLFKTEEICQEQINIVGLPFLKEKYPYSKIIKSKCIYWNLNSSEVET